MTQLYGIRRERQRWYVVFASGVPGSFWNCFTRRGYGHCFAFREHWVEGQPGLLNTAFTLKVEMQQSYVDTDFWYATPAVVAEHYLRDEQVADVVRVDVDIDGRRGYIPRGMLSCVTVLKAVLQLRAWWVLTPRQLHQYLLLRGGSSLRSELHEQSD